MSAEETRREELEREADARRERLVQTLGALDQRRHRILSPARQARRFALPLGGVAAAILVGFGVGEALARRALHRREDELRRMGIPVPPSAAAALTQQPLLPQILRTAAVSFVSVLVSTLARRALAQQLLGAPQAPAERPPAVAPPFDPAAPPLERAPEPAVLQAQTEEPAREIELTVLELHPIHG